ncbi:phage portal protein family protein [Rhodanobacter lindaniclasticus]
MTIPQLDREIATTADGIDITRGYTGPLLTPYDSVLRNRGGDLTLYEQVYSDPEVKAAFGQRQLAVTKCEWQVDPGGKRAIDKTAADFMRDQLQAIGWDNITSKMLFGVFVWLRRVRADLRGAGQPPGHRAGCWLYPRRQRVRAACPGHARQGG